MDLFTEFFSVTHSFGQNHIPYAVVGGIAMAFHQEPRFTRDVDLLILPEDIEKVKKTLSVLHYAVSSPSWTFRDSTLTLHRFLKTEGEDHLILDILCGNEERYRQIVENAILEESAAGIICLARKEDIVWMKQQRGSDQDSVDIRRLTDDKN